jgi:hypothetical protein
MDDCVQCGYCCTVRQCSYGQWNQVERRCKFLTKDRLCERHELIMKAEKNSEYPMFGCGCSSSLFNEVREAKIRATKEK